MDETVGVQCLLELQRELLVACLQKLQAQDVSRCACVCVQLKGVAYDDHAIWRPLCNQQYGSVTDPQQWLQTAATTTAAAADAGTGREGGHTHTYRQLYPQLQALAPCTGLWAAAQQGIHGDIWHFCWAPDCLQAAKLQPRPSWGWPVTSQVQHSFGPAHPQLQLELLDDDKLLLKEVVVRQASSSSAAELAAAGVLGSSPGSSFSQEFARFLSTSMSPGSSARRSRRSGSGSYGSYGSSSAAPCSRRSSSSSRPPVTKVVEHFRRLVAPKPTRQHPHAGLWKGQYGPHGLELSTVSYDFSGSSARITCTKLTGDVNVPAGQITWYADAAPLPQPWSEEEQQRVDQRPMFAAMSASVTQFYQQLQQVHQLAMQEQEQPPPFPAAELALVVEDAVLAAGEAATALAPQQQVVSVHAGQGQVAGTGFSSPRMVPGRLLVYGDGTLGFLFMEPHNFLIDYQRLDVGA